MATCTVAAAVVALASVTASSTVAAAADTCGVVTCVPHWPTRTELRDLVSAAGFHVDDQLSIVRLPGAILLPPVLTVATVLPTRSCALHARAMVR